MAQKQRLAVGQPRASHREFHSNIEVSFPIRKTRAFYVMLPLCVPCVTLQSHGDMGVGDRFVHMTCLPLYLDMQVVSQKEREDMVNIMKGT